jgi:ankyrin repeat protein
MYLKILNIQENHNNLQYKTGLIEDCIPFNNDPTLSCCSGGIYFSDEKYICEFLNYGIYIREVQIPDDAQMLKDPGGNKWRASKVILGERKELTDINTWKWLISVNADIHADNDYALRLASENGHLEVVKLLLEHNANIHSNNDDALRSASVNGHLEVVKLLLEHNADIHADNDYALRLASSKGHLEVVKLLQTVKQFQ